VKILLTCCVICLPLKQLRLTSAYGYRVHPVTGKYAFHAGVDLRAHADTVFAVMDGEANTVAYDNLLGLHITLQHAAVSSVYGHLSQAFVLPGKQVKSGDPIGITGSTGRVTGEHLHFSIRYGTLYINPLTFLYQLLIQQKHE